MIARLVALVVWPLRVLALTAVAVLVIAMSAEIMLRHNAALRDIDEPPSRLRDLDRAYEAFAVQHLHPTYLFFFPLDAEQRLALGNDVVSIDRDGFREPGPALRDGRKLAVMLGGSALFGHFSSSNATTITSRLNSLQDEFFFVNAGVPSWNSTQELQRLIFEIADLQPALVMTYDGANDGGLAGRGSTRRDFVFPPGTPESFDDLEAWVDDLRTDAFFFRMPEFFPALTSLRDRYLDAMRVMEDEEPTVITESDVADAARTYLTNQRRMAELSRAIGARFISVYQPVAGLHRNVPAAWREGGPNDEPFHRYVARETRGYEFHDLAAMFDAHFTSIPVAGADITDDTIFVDGVHLYDRGSELVARRLMEIVRTPPSSR